MAMNIDDFVAGIKGVPFTPGKSGFPENIGVGSREAFNLKFEGGSSYWWNAGGDNPMSIQKLAHSSTTYANAQRLDPREVNETIAKSNGMTVGELRSAIEKGDAKGSIVFGRLPKQSSTMYSGGGENMGEAFQASESIKPRSVMELPTQIEHHRGGASFVSGGKRTALNSTDFTRPEMHDWMKSFAQNVKDTVGEGVSLPAGTQELLDAPTMSEGNTAFRKYLESSGKIDTYPEARLTSIMPDSEGLLNFQYTGPEGQSLNAQTRRASIDAHISRPVLGPEAKISTSAIMDIGAPAEGLTTRAGMQRSY
jgi:hypothetical protein